MPTPTLFIVRGLPGSGKSTLATKIQQAYFDAQRYDIMHFEADQFFYDETGYNFDRRLLGAAHDYCYSRTIAWLVAGHSVVVANTFVTRREIERYTLGVKRCGIDCDVNVVTCTGSFGSIHNVPKRSIEKMRARWEPYEGEMFHTETAQ